MVMISRTRPMSWVRANHNSNLSNLDFSAATCGLAIIAGLQSVSPLARCRAKIPAKEPDKESPHRLAGPALSRPQRAVLLPRLPAAPAPPAPEITLGAFRSLGQLYPPGCQIEIAERPRHRRIRVKVALGKGEGVTRAQKEISPDRCCRTAVDDGGNCPCSRRVLGGPQHDLMGQRRYSRKGWHCKQIGIVECAGAVEV